MDIFKSLDLKLYLDIKFVGGKTLQPILEIIKNFMKLVHPNISEAAKKLIQGCVCELMLLLSVIIFYSQIN